MEIGDSIRTFRLSRKVTQKDLSEKTGLSYAFLNEIEKGKKKPSAETLFRIASFFNVTISELLGETTSSLTVEQQELLALSKNLTPEQLKKLTEFIKSMK